jgi:hypothetical protein
MNGRIIEHFDTGNFARPFHNSSGYSRPHRHQKRTFYHILLHEFDTYLPVAVL